MMLDPFRDDLLRWRKEHKSLADMATLLMEHGVDVSIMTISVSLRKWDAPPSPCKGPRKNPVITERDAKIYQLHITQNIPVMELSERFGLSEEYIRVIIGMQRRKVRAWEAKIEAIDDV